MKNSNSQPRIKPISMAFLMTGILTITACSSDSDSDDPNAIPVCTADFVTPDQSANAGAQNGTNQLAFTAVGSFPSGQIERISITDGYNIDQSYPATGSDIVVETDGDAIYQIGRFQIDSITRYNINDPSIVDYQYSVNGTETGANPYDIAFVTENKAYLLRYGSPKMWIINPDSADESDFVACEIDLSAYDPDLTDTDLSPNPESAVIVDDKLFVLMQRLSVFNPIEQSYVAVFDISTNEEIDTGKGQAENLNGIPLNVLNATGITYNETTDQIYVTGRGNIFQQANELPGDPYQGGLLAIDPTTYDVTQLLDDGDETNNQGFIEKSLIIDDTTGYVSLYEGYDPMTFVPINAMYEFNPSTGVVGNQVAALAGEDISALTLGSDGNVWFGIRGTTPGFRLLNPQDNSFVRDVATTLNPINVVFLNTP